MEHERFIARRRARFDGIDGKVNIPYGTALTCQDGFLMQFWIVRWISPLECLTSISFTSSTVRGVRSSLTSLLNKHHLVL